MSLVAKLLGYRPYDNPDHAIVQVVATGNYTTGGDTLNINPSAITDPNGKGLLGVPLNPTIIPPSFENQNIGGYYAQFVAGTTLANGKVKFYQSQAAELAQAAYPVAISGGVLTLKVPL